MESSNKSNVGMVESSNGRRIVKESNGDMIKSSNRRLGMQMVV